MSWLSKLLGIETKGQPDSQSTPTKQGPRSDSGREESAAQSSDGTVVTLSDGYFRELSRRLIEEHGSLLKMTDSGNAGAVKWYVYYKDGTILLMGAPGKLHLGPPLMFEKKDLDVDFFSGGGPFQGRRWAAVFFEEAGIDLKVQDIFDMAGGWSIELREGKTVYG